MAHYNSCSLCGNLSTWITVVMLELIHVQLPDLLGGLCLLATEPVQAIPGSLASHDNLNILYGISRWWFIQASDLSASDGWAFAYPGNDG